MANNGLRHRLVNPGMHLARAGATMLLPDPGAPRMAVIMLPK